MPYGERTGDHARAEAERAGAALCPPVGCDELIEALGSTCSVSFPCSASRRSWVAVSGNTRRNLLSALSDSTDSRTRRAG